MPSQLPLSVNRPSPIRYTSTAFDDEPITALRWPCLQRKYNTVNRPILEPLAVTKPAPTTSKEWKKRLAEIKRDYINRKYQQCYSRCTEVLDAAKDSHQRVAAYLIYIRFYAASAMEMQARAVPSNCPHRMKLFQQAREHYLLASELAADEDSSMRRPSSRAFSPVPSLHSPVGSELSYSTASTRMSSPAPSVSSLDGCMKNPNAAPKPKKRVAFCDVPMYEPTIRPDSPTLGFDDWCSSEPTSEPEEPVVLAISEPHRPRSSEKSKFSQDDNTAPPSVDQFMHTRSIHHYCTVLNHLQQQIALHLSWVDQTIATARSCELPQVPTEEMLALDVQTRIERLRACGWKRRRFDAKRYEALRERALASAN